MKIYDRPGFPNPARIRIVLAAKGLESRVEFIPVDLIAAEHKQPAFLAKNPAGVVPVLELDDGTLIGESTAITEYLDNLDGRPLLTGSTPREKCGNSSASSCATSRPPNSACVGIWNESRTVCPRSQSSRRVDSKFADCRTASTK